jgi:hypothetical protein
LSAFRDGSVDEGKVILREVMRMLIAYESLTRLLTNSDDEYGHGWYGNIEPPDPPVIRDGWKTFTIILEVYRVEQFQLTKEGGLLATPVSRLLDGCSLSPVPGKAVGIFNVQEYLYRFSGRANHIDGADATPPRLQLFAFLLHEYFNLQFEQGHLWRSDKDEDHLQFLSDGTIFTNNLLARSAGRMILAHFIE